MLDLHPSLKKGCQENITFYPKTIIKIKKEALIENYPPKSTYTLL